jgi:hypothetical protein
MLLLVGEILGENASFATLMEHGAFFGGLRSGV